MSVRKPHVSGTLQAGLPTTASSQSVQRFLAELKAVRGLTAMQTQWIARDQADKLLVGQYVLEKILGQGHYGTCYLGAHLATGQTASLRILSSAFTRGDLTTLSRVVRTAQSLPSASSSVQLPVHSGLASGRLFFASRYVVGEELARFVERNGPIKVDRALVCIIRALDGLIEIGKCQSHHGQLRPSKLLLNRVGDICIRDMALANVLQQRQPVTSRQSQIQALPANHVRYMAPELFLDENNSGFRADIYALGCILYYLSTGESVYPGNDPLRVAIAHRESKIPSLAKKLKKVPDSLDLCLRKMLAKPPSERFESYAHCQSTLRSIVVSIDKRATGKYSWWEIDDEETRAAKPVRSALRFRPTRRPVNKMMLSAILLGGVAASAACGYRWMNPANKVQNDEPRTVQTVGAEEAFTLP